MTSIVRSLASVKQCWLFSLRRYISRDHFEGLAYILNSCFNFLIVWWLESDFCHKLCRKSRSLKVIGYTPGFEYYLNWWVSLHVLSRDTEIMSLSVKILSPNDWFIWKMKNLSGVKPKFRRFLCGRSSLASLAIISRLGGMNHSEDMGFAVLEQSTTTNWRSTS